MATRTARLSILAAILTIIVLISFLVFWNTRSTDFSVAYEKVRVGETKANVIRLFGASPDEVTPCNEPSGQFEASCGEIYWYFSLFERWEIRFDRNGRVVDKGHNLFF